MLSDFFPPFVSNAVLSMAIAFFVSSPTLAIAQVSTIREEYLDYVTNLIEDRQDPDLPIPRGSAHDRINSGWAYWVDAKMRPSPPPFQEFVPRFARDISKEIPGCPKWWLDIVAQAELRKDGTISLPLLDFEPQFLDIEKNDSKFPTDGNNGLLEVTDGEHKTRIRANDYFPELANKSSFCTFKKVSKGREYTFVCIYDSFGDFQLWSFSAAGRLLWMKQIDLRKPAKPGHGHHFFGRMSFSTIGFPEKDSTDIYVYLIAYNSIGLFAFDANTGEPKIVFRSDVFGEIGLDE